MKWLPRSRISWAVMFGLLLASLLGANWIIHNPRHLGNAERGAAGGADKASVTSTQHATGFTQAGMVVPEGSIVPLMPSVKGEVIQVLAKEDDRVKKGEVLLKMDDRAAKFDLARAENAVKNAELLLKKAKDGIREWELRREIQLKQIEVRRAQYAQAWELMTKLKKFADDKMLTTSEVDYKMARHKAEEAKAGLEAEEKGLELLDHKKPALELEQADVGLRESQLQRDKAKLGVEVCELKAPADGTIIRSYVSVGDKFGEQLVKPAFLFYEGGLIVRADIVQEWAHRVKEGQTVVIHDAGASGQTWKGQVYKMGRSFLPKRDASGAMEGVNILQQSQEPVLECRIRLDPDQPTPFLNQKVRIHFEK